jgi:hypothetical protein
MTLPEAREIFQQMQAQNPLVAELHKRFELGAPERGSKNIETCQKKEGTSASSSLSKQAQPQKTQ